MPKKLFVSIAKLSKFCTYIPTSEPRPATNLYTQHKESTLERNPVFFSKDQGILRVLNAYKK